MSTLFKDTVLFETYGETIAVGDILYKSTGTGSDSGRDAGKLYKLDVSNPDRNVFYGIAKEAGIADDTNKKIVTGGKFDGLSALTPGLPVYADPLVAGGVTQVRPASGAQVIGIAIDADSISVNAALGGSFGAGEGSGGVGGVDILFVQDFETAAIGDFDEVGLVLDNTNPLKGSISAKLIHDDTINQSFKQTIAVDEKFRNRNLTLKLNIKSEASQGNVTLTVVDETNAVTLVNSEQLPVSNDVGGAIGQVSFDVPDDCLSLSYEVIALPEAGDPVTIVDDVIAEITNLLDVNSVLVQEADSYLSVRGTASHSTNTALPFNEVRDIKGSAITFNGSDTFTVNESGIYDINLRVRVGSASGSGYETDLRINGVTIRNSAGWSSNGDNTLSNATPLVAGDTIQFVKISGGGSSTNRELTITKQGSLKQINPNPNSKITIPTSELRMEGASTRGSTATAIVRFNDIAKLRGDAFEVLSDATLGTRIVMKKKGKLDVSTTLRLATASQYFGISRNQQTLTARALLGEIVSESGHSTGSVANSCSVAIDVSIGDVIRVYSTAGITSETSNALNLFFQEQDISVSVTNTLPQFSESDSCVQLSGANGYGSTNTDYRRFSNVLQNIGTDIEYSDSATLGNSFTIKSDGIYHISYSEQSTANVVSVQIRLEIDGNTVVEDGDRINTATNNPKRANVSWSGYLLAGQVVNAAVGLPTSLNGEAVHFSIAKVGKPNVTGVDVTPFVNIPQPTITEWSNPEPIQIDAVTTAPTKGAPTVDQVRWRRVGQDYEVEYKLTMTTNGTAGSGEYLIRLPSGIAFDNSYPLSTGVGNVRLLVAARSSGIATDGNITQNSDTNVSGNVTAAAVYSPNSFRLGVSNLGTSTGTWGSGYFQLSTARSIDFRIKFRGKGLTATNPNLLTAPESFSTDTALLQYAPSSLYTLATLDTAPVGTYITFTYAANTNTRTQTTTRPTQTDADMNVNGMRIFTRAYNAASTAGNPAAIAIQIGKGLKGKSLNLYKGTGKDIAGSLDTKSGSSTYNILYGAAFKEYNEATGILYIDAGHQINTNVTSALFQFSDLTTQANGYLVVNASKSPVLTSVPVMQVRTAVFRDEKAQNVAGGTATTTFTARILNTLQDPTGIIINSSAFTGTGGTNTQFILSKGQYNIEGFSVFGTDILSKVRVFNVTQGISVLEGTSSDSATGTNTLSYVQGIVNIASETVFEIQASSGAANANGWGIASNRGGNEVYSQYKVIKIK